MNRYSYLVIALLILYTFFTTSVFAQDLQEQELKVDFQAMESEVIPKEEGFLYNLQKYTGFNLLTHKLAVFSLKTIIKLKTKANKTDIDLKIYSGLDLFKKRIKSIELETEDLYIKNVPIGKFYFDTPGPIIIKKIKLKNKRRNRVVVPLYASLRIEINLDEINRVINTLPKWTKVLNEINMPIPPFGSTQIAIKDFDIHVMDNGHANISAKLISLVNPESEPLDLNFSGNLQLEDKQLKVVNIESQVEDILTGSSEMEEAFSKMLEDLINPVFKFNKYERKGLKINNIDMTFEANKVVFLLKVLVEPVNQSENDD